ncbi:MAG: hypothetical protein ABI867_20400, partial [Kofleriaceae bacterium]
EAPMTTPADKVNAPVVDTDIHFDGAAPDAADRAHGRAAKEVWSDIDAILNGSSKKATDLTQLVGELDDDGRSKFARESLAAAAKVASGDLVLELALATNAAPTAAIRAVLAKGATKKPGAAALRSYVGRLSATTLAAIRGAEFQTMRGVLTGDIFDELPMIARHLTYLDANADFIGWLLESSQKRVVATLLAETYMGTLAKTLDTLQQWSWVDDVPHPRGHLGLHSLAKATSDPAAKQKMHALAGPLGGQTTEPYRAEHAGDVEGALASKATPDKLLDAATQQGQLADGQLAQVVETLKAQGVTADDALVFVLRFGPEPADAFELVLGGKGVTPAHVKTLFAARPGTVAALASARTVAKTRGKLGTIRLEDIVRDSSEMHRFVVEHEALREWYLEKASPEELLWFCAGSEEAITKACRVIARDRGFGWVRTLNAHTADSLQLRRLALGCNEPGTAKFIRENLLDDHKDRHGAAVTTAAAPDVNTRAGEGGRLVDVLEHGGADLVARLADVDESKRIALAHDDTTVRMFGDAAQPPQWAQIAHMLDLPVRSAILGCPGTSAATLAYLRTRPAAEETAALGETAVIERAASHVDPDLLLVFPSLAQVEQLAVVVGRMPKLVDLLLAGSEPNKVMTLLSTDPVKAKAAARLEHHSKLLAHLPDREHMTKAGRAGTDKFAAAVDPDSKAGNKLADHADGQTIGSVAAHAEGARFASANAKSLPEAIDSLVAAGAAPTTVLGVLEQHRKEVPALLAEKEHAPRVRSLFRHVSLAPNVVFPYLGVDELFALANARWWMFAAQPHFLVLDLVATHASARGKIAAALNAGESAALLWLERLPPAAELTTQELHVLDLIQPSLTSADAFADLFKARFGVPLESRDLKQLRSMYRIISRLPRSHVQQQRIREIAVGSGDGGSWQSADRDKDGEPDNQMIIGDGMQEGGKKDEFHPGEKRHSWDEMKRIYGYDDDSLKAQIDAGRVLRTIEHSTPMYYMKTQRPDRLTTVVLHEIGHSIDNILGNRTEPVYGFAKWKSYPDGEFEKWASEMPGWSKVSTTDRTAIHEAWRNAFNAKAAVKDLVDHDHPARAAKYKGVGIVDLANTGTNLHHQIDTVGGRAYLIDYSHAQYHSLAADAAASAPSDYSLTAPPEYFAECYVEYYREVDGSSGSLAKKGGALPGPVKQWFDGNVDKLKFDPERLRTKK